MLNSVVISAQSRLVTAFVGASELDKIFFAGGYRVEPLGVAEWDEFVLATVHDQNGTGDALEFGQRVITVLREHVHGKIGIQSLSGIRKRRERRLEDERPRFIVRRKVRRHRSTQRAAGNDDALRSFSFFLHQPVPSRLSIAVNPLFSGTALTLAIAAIIQSQDVIPEPVEHIERVEIKRDILFIAVKKKDGAFWLGGWNVPGRERGAV